MTPLGRVLFPGLSHLASEPEKLAAAFNKVMSAVAVAAFAVAIGIALVADDFITLALGARWRETVPPVRVLAIASGTLMLSQPCSVLLTVTNRARLAATFGLLHLLLLVIAMVPAALWSDLQNVALARAAATASPL